MQMHLACVQLETREATRDLCCNASGGTASAEDFGSFLHGPASPSSEGLYCLIWKLAHLFPIEMSYELYVLDIIQVNKWRWNEL